MTPIVHGARAKRQTQRSDPALRSDALALYTEMTRVARLYTFRERDRVGYHGLTITETHILHALVGLGTASVVELAALLRLDKSTTSRAVDALVRKHLLRRGVSGTDARTLRIEATPEGEKRYRRIRDDLLEESVAALSAFAPAIRRPMIDLVRRLGDELEGRALEQIEPSDLP